MFSKKNIVRALSALTVLVLLLAGVAVNPALAHGRVEVGDYLLVIGFRAEPAYQGEPNGLDLTITNKNTKEPIKGLEETLKAELIYGSSKQTYALKTQFGKEGAYTLDVIPTEAGDYTWHIFGKIKDTPVDISMTSSPKTFSAVQAKSNVAFPAAEPTVNDLKAQVASANQAAQAAAQAAQTALIVGIVGAVLGVVGIGVGAWGLRKK